MNKQDSSRFKNHYGMHNDKPLDVMITRGEGVWEWDAAVQLWSVLTE